MGGKRKSNLRGSAGYDKKYKPRDLDSQSVGSASTKSDPDVKVDKILDRRIARGKTEYLCSWKGLGSYESTWEREDELDCEDLIDDFNDNVGRGNYIDDETYTPHVRHRTTANGTGNGSDFVSSSSDNKYNRISKSAPLTGTKFDQGFQADFILGHSTNDKGERMFLIKWKDSEEADMVPAEVANKKCPAQVISFFESRTELRNGQLYFKK